MKVKEYFSIIYLVPLSLIFCFRNLPFKQAIKLPILICPSSLFPFIWKNIILKPKGRFLINCKSVKTGMIRLGVNLVSIYPNKGILIDNKKEIVFNGKCVIGNGSILSVLPTGSLQFGDKFYATTTLRVVCAQKIVFGDNCLIGWDNLFMDTDLHVIKKYSSNSRLGVGYKPIRIGANNWFCMKTVSLKGTITPDFTIVANNSVLRDDYSNIGNYCIIGGVDEVKIKKRDVYLDRQDNQIEWSMLNNYDCIL